MDAILRSVVVYVVLFVVMRISGKRTFSEVTTFEFVLLLIVGEATQQSILGNDFSVTNGILVILTLVGLDVGVSLIKQRSRTVSKVLDSVPIILLENGKPLKDRMQKVRVDETDILVSAREKGGLERLDQIKYAVLERSGGISIIPMPGEGG